MTVPAEVLLIGGYAVALLGVAVGLDWLGKHTASRADRFRTAGFRYHPTHDAWVCPRDEMLWPSGYDAELHLLRYRAKPSVCNACPVKAACTSSAHGREITRPLAPWPHSEAGRFHRGLSLVLVGLAAMLVVATAVGHRDPLSLGLLGAVLLMAGAVGYRLSAHFRAAPANFPAATPATGLRVAPTSRTRWGSDARVPR
ncbi:MAG: hypothetical protein ABJC62_05470 [Frankiaceae bacterium]